VIERFAENAYRKANAIFIGCVTAGVVLGAIFGATPLTPLGAGWPIPAAFGFATTLLGAVVGGVIGYVVGDTRSALCRLQGQTALAQVESAKHARAMTKAMEEIHEIHEQIRSLGVAAAPEPVREQLPEPPPVVPVLPALRVAGSNQVQPPPLTPPSP
jgi:membrane protein DedA with SNARE-associated domain